MATVSGLNWLAEIYVPDGSDPVEALRRTTHLAVGAHPDDVEIMAQHGILACYQQSDLHFTAVIAANGAGSPRNGSYADASDADLIRLRRREQLQAAEAGAYSAVVLLNHSSADIKSTDIADTSPLRNDLLQLLALTRPAVLYTHQPADRHPTHVAVCVRVIEALRSLPVKERPAEIYGCEVWRSLDWVNEAERISLDVSGREELRRTLLQVFKSQIDGGKRYDLAAIGRQQANAVFDSSHCTDALTAVNYAIDLAPALAEAGPEAYLNRLIGGFHKQTIETLRLFTSDATKKET